MNPKSPRHSLLKSFWYRFSLAVFFVLVCVDLLAKAWGIQLGEIGYAFWFVSHAIIALHSLRCLLLLIRGAFSCRFLGTFCVVLLHFILTFLFLSDSRFVHYESTQETTCGIQRLITNPQSGYFEKCFWNYPARQYAISALPTILIGNNLTALNLGGALYFLIGLPIFTHALLLLAGKGVRGDLAVAISLALLSHWIYFNDLRLGYEQSFFPVSLSLTLLGLLLQYAISSSKLLAPYIGLSLLHHLFAYPPALATYALGVVTIGYFTFQDFKQKQRWQVTAAILLGSVLAAMTLFDGRPDVNMPTWTFWTNNALQLLWKVTRQILFQDQGWPFLTPLLHPFFIVITIAGLCGLLGRVAFCVSAWMVCVLYASLFLIGIKNWPDLAWRDLRGLHRALIIAPVFSTLVFYIFKKRGWIDLLSVRGLGFTLVIVVAFGAYDLGKKVFNRSPHPVYVLLQALRPFLATATTPIEVDPALANAGFVITDFSGYFLPEFSFFINKTGAGCLSQVTPKTDFALVLEESPCDKKIRRLPNSQLIVSFSLGRSMANFLRINPPREDQS